MCLLAVLGSQGIVVKCTAAIFFCTVDSIAFLSLLSTNQTDCENWWINLQCMDIQIKAIEQWFHVLFIMLYKVVLTSKTVDVTLVCDHSNKCYSETYIKRAPY